MPTPGGDGGALTECCLPLWAVLVRMLDFTLLKSATFVTVCTASALAMAGKLSKRHHSHALHGTVSKIFCKIYI